MAEMAGLRYSDLLKLIIEAAQERVAAQHPGLVIPLAERRAQRAPAAARVRLARHQTFIFPNSPLRRRQISVSIGVSTHSHVPMAHGGYATT